MMLGSIGDVASSCGPSPCTWQESLFPGAACQVWNACAAAQTPGAPVVGAPCVVGGLDANGNTIVSCGQTGFDPTESPYPVVTSAPCAGMTPEQCAAVSGPSAVGVPQWALLAGVVFALAMIAGRR